MSDPSTHKAKQHAVANMATNLVVVAITALIGLWLTSYLINELSTEVYSIVPLAVSIGSYLNIVTTLITGSSTRYVSIHFNQGDAEKSNMYFNSSFFGILYMSLILLVPAILISFAGIHLLNMPQEAHGDTSVLFLMILISVLVSAIAHPLAVSTFMTHQFYMSNIAKIASRIVQVLLLVGLFRFMGTRLIWVGLSYLGMSLVILVANYALSLRLTPTLKLNPRKFRFREAKEVCGMGAWLVIDRVGTLLYLNTDLVIINLMLGAEQCGLYAPVLQWVILIRLLPPALGSILDPIAMEKIAQGKLADLARLTTQGIRLMGLALAIPIGVIAGLSRPLLRVWLGEEFEDLYILLMMMILAQSFFLPLNPIYNITRGLNKVRFPALATAIGGVVNVLLSIALIRYAGLGILGVGLATVICFAARTTLALSRYAAKQLGLPQFSLLKNLGPGISLSVSLTIIGLLASRQIAINDYTGLMLIASGIAATGALLSFLLFLKPDDRKLLVELSRHARNQS